MLDDFPSTHGEDRENLILDIVKNQPDRVTYDWSTIKSDHEGHSATFFVMSDALKIDGVRVNVNAATKQKIADEWSAMLMTAKIADMIWHQAEVRLEPRPRSITSSTQAMIDHSKDIDKQLEGKEYEGKLISTVGKYWIIDSAMANGRFGSRQAINYGWHFKGTSFQGITGGVNASLLKDPDNGMYWKMIQTIGGHHDDTHVDYSQICRLVSRQCVVNGKARDLQEILKDPELSYLASHSGPQPVLRQASVPAPNVVFIPGGVFADGKWHS